jgi:hypothetical protein
MTVPDFDNIDLAIIVIGLVMIVVAIGLMISGKIEAGLGFLGTRQSQGWRKDKKRFHSYSDRIA